MALLFLLVRQNLFYFSCAGKFCLAHMLRQLTCNVKSDIRTLNSRSDVIFAPPGQRLNDVQKIIIMLPVLELL